MIEIIQEENWETSQDRRGLPKNIKQIGTPDMGDRIYIENSAFRKCTHTDNIQKKWFMLCWGVLMTLRGTPAFL